MSKANPAWRGKILVEQYGAKGEVSYTLSSTRQTRPTPTFGTLAGAALPAQQKGKEAA